MKAKSHFGMFLSFPGSNVDEEHPLFVPIVVPHNALPLATTFFKGDGQSSDWVMSISAILIQPPDCPTQTLFPISQ